MIAPYSDGDGDTAVASGLRRARHVVAAALFTTPDPGARCGTRVPPRIAWLACGWMILVLSAYASSMFGWFK